MVCRATLTVHHNQFPMASTFGSIPIMACMAGLSWRSHITANLQQENTITLFAFIPHLATLTATYYALLLANLCLFKCYMVRAGGEAEGSASGESQQSRQACGADAVKAQGPCEVDAAGVAMDPHNNPARSSVENAGTCGGGDGGLGYGVFGIVCRFVQDVLHQAERFESKVLDLTARNQAQISAAAGTLCGAAAFSGFAW